MTTATRRLRRASIAGLATFATAAVVVATAGSAVAFPASGAGGGGSIAQTGQVTVYPGVASQALNNVTLTLADKSGAGWASGDFLTLQLVNGAVVASPELCSTSTNVNATASLATIPAADVTALSGGATAFTGFSIAQTSGANCSAKDNIVLTFTAGAPADTNNTVFTITGLSLSLGTNFPTAPAVVNLVATASNGAPFGTVNAGTATATTHTAAPLDLATVGNVSVTGGTVVGVTSGAANVTVGPIVTTDVTGGHLTTNISYTLTGSGDLWATAGTLSLPSGLVLGTAATAGGAVLTFTFTGTATAGQAITLTGATVNFAAAAGAHTVGVRSNSVLFGSPQIAFLGAQNRVGGADRYGTAALIFNEAFSTVTATTAGITPAFLAPHVATSVVVTSGTNYPDALSSAYLAASLGTGILLTDPNLLPSATQQVLINGHINTVYIVGGTAAVSSNVQNAIAALKNPATSANLNVIRIAGADRYATNQAADLNSGVVGSGSQTAVLATGTNFADALAASPAIAAKHYPLILTTPNALSASAAATITALGVKNIVILGGTSAVSAAVETSVKALPGVTVLQRLAGADRTQTAQQIALWETQGVPAGSYTALLPLGFFWGATVNVDITNGANFPDALAAGPALATAGTLTAGVPTGEPLLLTASPTVLGAGIPAFLGGSAAHVNTVSAVGLASAVSPSVLASAAGSIS